MPEVRLPYDTSRMGTERVNGTTGRIGHQNNSKRGEINLEERNVCIEGKKSQIRLTSAKDLTIMVHVACDSTYHELTNLYCT